jgi:hypothetical protein
MTLEQLNAYNPIATIFMGFLQTSGMENFVIAFQTFAPTISSEIASYYADNTCTCQSKISLYVELYKDSSAEFLYNYAEQNDLLPFVQSLMVTSLEYTVDLTGKVAKIKIADWFSFSAKVAGANFRSFSTSLSGDDVLVFFI